MDDPSDGVGQARDAGLRASEYCGLGDTRSKGNGSTCTCDPGGQWMCLPTPDCRLGEMRHTTAAAECICGEQSDWQCGEPLDAGTPSQDAMTEGLDEDAATGGNQPDPEAEIDEPTPDSRRPSMRHRCGDGIVHDPGIQLIRGPLAAWWVYAARRVSHPGAG
jgi:hypothetical protein